MASELKFRIEQVAIAPPDPEKARKLLAAMGFASEWIEDHVVASGEVYGHAAANEADLAFNYEGLEQAREFEVLHYTKGLNWLSPFNGPRVSHFGMHCSAEELAGWREFFAARRIEVAQEVVTVSHTNEAIAGKRHYQYVIFRTSPILGVDTKFIVRMEDTPGAAAERQAGARL